MKCYQVRKVDELIIRKADELIVHKVDEFTIVHKGDNFIPEG